MKLSVILVNNNSGLLLKQALNSLAVAANGIDYEFIVMDDADTDVPASIFVGDFPDLKVIPNTEVTGISKAYNQALKQAGGEYVLLANADTICGKDTLEKMCTFMDEHRDTGGLTIRMLSPQGRFLPESIHGLNKQWATFFKFIGFAKHLPKTRLYDRNRKDWVEEFQISEIDILNVGFMMLRKSVLTETGLFDERFSRFGYNIDISYRIRLAGFKNYYFPKTYIINFESGPTPKFSFGYLKYFYGAMLIFALKYLVKVPQIKVQGMPQVFSSTYEIKG